MLGLKTPGSSLRLERLTFPRPRLLLTGGQLLLDLQVLIVFRFLLVLKQAEKQYFEIVDLLMWIAFNTEGAMDQC